MESFGCWYKLQNNSCTEENDTSKLENRAPVPDFDLHVNFWFLGDILKQKIKYRYLDIGIKIKNYQSLSNFVFSFPFHVNSNEVIDLSSKMSNKTNASMVFNEECEIETQKEYTIVKIPDKEKKADKKLLIFPLEQAIENICEYIDCGDKTYIVIRFENFKKYLGKNSELEVYKDIYIRFRIKDINLQDILYFDNEPFNKSLDSAFSGTRVLDFKINEKRNIDKSITARMDLDEETLIRFSQVHFLVMEPSSYDLIAYTKNQMTCRELEKDLWNDYLKVDLDSKAGHILAYHWRMKSEDDHKIGDFSCFAKIKYQKMQLNTVLAYVLVVLGIGVIGSTIVSATPLLNSIFLWKNGQYVLPNLILDLIFGVLMLLAGWALGKRK